MVKVITYGTFDVLHHGHVKLLKRAKALGDYLIVGITADDFDKKRGKINVKQSLIERIEAVKALGIADEIVVEEYEGQKIDDIIRNNIDIFTVGSDWDGKFDYLKEFCEVVYLPRTQGISSSQIRSNSSKVRLGIVGDVEALTEFVEACSFVNGVSIVGVCTDNVKMAEEEFSHIGLITEDYCELLKEVDAIYLISHPTKHYEQIKKAISDRKHVLCQSPLTLAKKHSIELLEMARESNCILMEALKNAYSTAYSRLLLLLKSDIIGRIVSIDSVCTSRKNIAKCSNSEIGKKWNSICSWGGIAMLPIFQLLGVDYIDKKTISSFIDEQKTYDAFTKINFTFKDAISSIMVGQGIKSEGELVITGTEGYVYVPAPWWKMDYFEIRYENPVENKRYFYNLENEGRKYEIVEFIRSIETGKRSRYINEEVSVAISSVIEDFYTRKDFFEI